MVPYSATTFMFAAAKGGSENYIAFQTAMAGMSAVTAIVRVIASWLSGSPVSFSEM